MKPKQNIAAVFHKQSDIEKNEYRIRLQGSIDAVRYLMHNALPFRGHDESEDSMHRGVFLETLKLIASQNENARKAMLKAPKNCKLTSPDIQKDIVDCFAKQVLKSIFDEIGDDVFSLLVDKSSDVSRKEQMAVVLRYVRGQGYDGASNMRGEFNGLKALILRDNSSAFYVYCFAHQLQLVVVAVAKHHEGVGDFFYKLALAVSVVFASCKRNDMIRDARKDRLEEEIASGEVETGTGKNQERSLYVKEKGDNALSRRQASGLANVLSQSLQRKDQNILEAVSLVQGTRMSLQNFRENGFDGLLKEVNAFCQKYDLEMLNIDEVYVVSRN
ncbi:uncharacterized protein [Rutidosis leptorrhynchoides]|uniref:uncharacterized protein n=1 Tax=Rutidosis leptorrhynchoides TaxID=125765 RepID=UPI003A99D0A1